MILVVGGTGELGRRVVAYLRGRDERVRCLVRPATDDGAMVALGAEVVRGDLTDAATLPPACSGVDTVVSGATAIARRLAGSGPSLRDVDEVGTVALVDAAAAAGVQRFVYVSYAGVDAGLGSPLERAKKAVEQRLRASSMREVLVRPDAFQDVHLVPLGRFDVAAGKVAVIGRGDTPRRWVSTDDVAALVAAVACEPDPPTVVEFGGPEAMTRNAAIATAEQLTGRRMRRQRMPRPVARLAMRLLDKRNDALATVFGAGLLQDVLVARWDDEPLRARGISPRSATEFLRLQAAAAGPG
jgi:uncharacterized protein YbjT (DUF2867 family)